jgi:dTMP kinase
MLRLISFEGGDGAGKSTQLAYLERYLASLKRSYVSTREPGGTALGRVMREALLGMSGETIVRNAEIFLYLADRAQHVEKIIRPALENQKLVLCDRFTDSTLAYQGYGRGFDLALLRSLNQIACGGIKPDLTLLLDLPPAVGLSRTRERERSSPRKRGAGKSPADRFESEGLEFHERVRCGFLRLAQAEPGRIVILDGSQSPSMIHEKIKEVVYQRLAAG